MIIPPLQALCLDCQAPTLAHTLKNTARNNLMVYYSCSCMTSWSRFYRNEAPRLQETLAPDEDNRYTIPRQLRQLIPPSDDDNWFDMRL